MPGSIKSIKRRPTAKSAAKRIGRMFKRTNSDDPEAITSTEPKDSFEGIRPSTSSRYSTSSRMTIREDAESPSPSTKDQFRPFASLFDPRRQKEPETVSSPPLVLANSEPVLETLEPVEFTKSVEVAKSIESEALTSSVYNEPETAEKQPEPPQQPEEIEKKKPEKKIEQVIEKQLAPKSPPRPAARPLPYPPAVQDATERPESPIIPVKEFRQDVFHPKSPVPPRPTVEDEPWTIEKPVKEARAKIESKVESKAEPKVAKNVRQRAQPKNILSKPQLKETKPKVEPESHPNNESKAVSEKSIPVQYPPDASNTTRKPAKAPSSRVTATPSTPAAQRKAFVPATFSPKTVPVPDTSALSISFQPTRTVFVPDTAPAPYTARPPITAQAPMIAKAPKVARSMFAWAVPEPASIPIIAAAPQRAY
ncbi:uncharacterized protein FTOL_07926 [Fusarium torulosum]|uniref:Uncharacterized protein n=1 Tax=Fusarium torulosum TaxID=33205 RepID=A0AAE8MCT9_9HYPO|nr:uncharacterized protein FTOL_07926 [Fusarium torulosum]